MNTGNVICQNTGGGKDESQYGGGYKNQYVVDKNIKVFII